jgi:hypothetical protein
MCIHRLLLNVCLATTATFIGVHETGAQQSVARLWNEALLEAISRDFARPTVHARNLFHTSVAMYDAWAAYDEVAAPYLLGRTVGGIHTPFDGVLIPGDVHSAREEAISYAAYRVLKHRFEFSPGSAVSLPMFDSLMVILGYDTSAVSTDYTSGSPASLGNYIARSVIEYGLEDGSNEQFDYNNLYYLPVNVPLDPVAPGNPNISDPNRWQPLEFGSFIDQGGNPVPFAVPPFLGAEWGNVIPFALTDDVAVEYVRNGHTYRVYHDPGPPPYLDTTAVGGISEEYKWSFVLVSIWHSHHDPNDGVMWDISPASLGNVPGLPQTFEEHRDFYNFIDGGDTGTGHDINPATGEPYEQNIVSRGDYTRVLAEYWADGPRSATPPGHWYILLNYISDHPLFEKRYMGTGEILDDLEWDVKTYFALGGTMHDAAVAAWSVKGWYDYVRPISAIRAMAEMGQSSDSDLPRYHPGGIILVDGYVELVGEGDPLAGEENENMGKIKLYTWRGHDHIEDPDSVSAGVGWILAENWWPFQLPTFVTPPFAGYVSGHSTYSRAAAEVMILLTGDEFFPGGLAEFHAPMNQYLEVENGPAADITLQWATFRDASDQTSLSRIWGGLHPPIDDIDGRMIGMKVGPDAFYHADKYFRGQVTTVGAPLVDTVLPDAWRLEQNYPNPFNPVTNIAFTVPSPSHVTMKIYDQIGREVTTLVAEELEAGRHAVQWNASGVSSGVYYYRIQAGDFIQSKKMVVMR